VRVLIAAWDCFVRTASFLAMTEKVKGVIANEVKQSPGCEDAYCCGRLLRRDAPRNDGGSRGCHCDFLPAVIASPLGCGYTKCDVVNPLVMRLIAAGDCFVAMLLAMTEKSKRRHCERSEAITWL